MSAGKHAEPALAFLADTSSRRRRPRGNAETLRIWFRLAMVCVLFLAAVSVPLLLPGKFGELALGWKLVAAAVGTAIGLEVSRIRLAFDHQATMVAAAVSAGLSGAVLLLSVGTSWRSAATWAGAEAILAMILLTALGFAYSRLFGSLIREGRLATRVAVIGSGPVAQRAVAQLEAGDPLKLQLVGRYTVYGGDLGCEQRGDVRTLLCDARLDMIDAIVLALEPAEADQIRTIQRALQACVQDVLVPGETVDSAPGGLPVQLGDARLLLLNQQPIRGASLAAKRAFDIIVACMLVAFMAPLLALIALAIRLETSGPILFRQLRVGYNNQLFYIFKFRSMYWNFSDRLAKQQTVKGDKRVTRVGRIIRRLSLDELPQLLNVMRGEMSLVGPRPHAPGTSIGGQRVHTLVEGYARRHLVRPGITGLAQVRGLRGGMEDRGQVADRISADLEYIERWSLWLDVRILLGTVLLEVRHSRGC